MFKNQFKGIILNYYASISRKFVTSTLGMPLEVWNFPAEKKN
jgi:hypothetical protein